MCIRAWLVRLEYSQCPFGSGPTDAGSGSPPGAFFDAFPDAADIYHLDALHTEGRVPLPNWMIFWKTSIWPLTPPPHCWKIMLQFF